MDAQEAADAEGARAAGAALGKAVEAQARLIAAKYVAPPHTTDFAIMFLPTESLYAEVLRRRGCWTGCTACASTWPAPAIWRPC